MLNQDLYIRSAHREVVTTEGKTQVSKRDCVNVIQMQNILVIHLDSEMELRVCEEVNGLSGLMTIYSAWIMIESQYSKQNFLIQSRNSKNLKSDLC